MLPKSDTVDTNRKLAYNYLLYWAMLEIRQLEWMWYKPFRLSYLSPFYWHRCLLRIRSCGALADALHNLALYSSCDYQGFDEERFWKGLDQLEKYHPNISRHYHQLFEDRLAELKSGQA